MESLVSSSRRGSYSYAVVPLQGRDKSPRMALDVFFVAPTALKLIFIVTTAVILDSVDPIYAVTYGSAGIESSWGAIFIYIVSAFTLFYVVVSIIAVFACKVSCSSDRNAACGIAELVVSSSFAMCWLLISGYAGSVSWRSGQDSSTQYGWISALGAINTACFLAICFINCAKVAQEKIEKRRNPQYQYRI